MDTLKYGYLRADKMDKEPMVINEYCKKCQLRRNLIKYPATASADEIAAYQQGVEIPQQTDPLV